MTNKEIALDLINKISPDRKLTSDTIEAIEELENGGGTKFSGSTKDLFKELEE